MNLDTLVDKLRKVVKDFLATAGDQIYVEVIDNMGEDIGAGPFRDSDSGALSLRAPRNTTNRLRFQTNRLGAALAPRERGNIFNVAVKNDVFEVEYGVDKNVVPYAAIHEFGGTIKHPGGTPYFINEDGRAVFVSRANGKDLRRTKPHTITIKARPYLKPGYEAWAAKLPQRLGNRIRKALEG